jgi:hypothetical protein
MTQQSFCQFPWTSLIVNLEKDLWRWCPKVPTRQGFAGYYPMSKDLDSVKQSFVNGEKPQQCNACWQQESIGFDSFRTINKGNEIGEYYRGLRFLDITLSTTCNMSCATCGPAASSRWKEIYIKDTTAPYRHKNLSISKFDRSVGFRKLCDLIAENIDTLERININGGEPTDDLDFYHLLAHLSNLSVVRDKPVLRIVTNANYKDPMMISRLNTLKSNGWRLNIVVSMDAAGPKQEFIRAGSDWNNFENNLKQLIDLGYCRSINVVVSPMNIGLLGSIPVWLEANGFLDTIKPNAIFSQHPFSVSILGGMAIYLIAGWKDSHREHINWKSFIEQVNKSARKQRFVVPDKVKLDEFIRYIIWYTEKNDLLMPVEVKKICYLVDLFNKQPKLFGKELPIASVDSEDVDPE